MMLLTQLGATSEEEGGSSPGNYKVKSISNPSHAGPSEVMQAYGVRITSTYGKTHRKFLYHLR